MTKLAEMGHDHLGLGISAQHLLQRRERCVLRLQVYDEGDAGFLRQAEQPVSVRAVERDIVVAVAASATALVARHVVTEVELAHDWVRTAAHVLFHLCDEVVTLLEPVGVGAAVGGEDETVGMRIGDFMNVIAPAIAAALTVAGLRCLVTVEGNERRAEVIHFRHRRRQVVFAVAPRQTRFEINERDHPAGQETIALCHATAFQPPDVRV